MGKGDRELIRLQLHMTRLGAGLTLLKETSQAPFSNIVSYADRVEFEFEGSSYQITQRVEESEKAA